MCLRPGNFFPCACQKRRASFLGRNGFHPASVSVRIWEIWIFDMIIEDLCCVITPRVPLSLVRRSNLSEAVVAPRDLNSAQHPPAPLAPRQPDIPDRFASRSAHEEWYKSVYLIILYMALVILPLCITAILVYLCMDLRPLVQTSTHVINGEETMSYFKRPIHFGVAITAEGRNRDERTTESR